MSQFVNRALRLWGEPLPEGDAALALFRTVYTDPLDVNGESTPLQVLLDRARMMGDAFEGLQHQVLEQFDAPGRLAFAFKITGRQTGPLETPLGQLAPTGLDVEVSGMDIFIIDEEIDRVAGVWALADYLGLLIRAGAVQQLTATSS
jgi:hypothetical protein